MTFRLRFPTLFDALPAPTGLYPALEAPGPRRSSRGRLTAAGLAAGLLGLAGCESPSPHALLDAETEQARSAEPPVRQAPRTLPVPPVDETVAPGSGAIRLPFALQGYGT